VSAEGELRRSLEEPATGGVPELLNEGAGLLVPPQDGFALANAIDRLLNDIVLEEQFARAGRRRIED
jgi:glycosyltransferase involved in cell wall biosynthesis